MQEVVRHFFKRWYNLDTDNSNNESQQQFTPELQELYTFILKQLSTNEEITKLDIQHLKDKQIIFKSKLQGEDAKYVDSKKYHENMLFQLGLEMERIQEEMKNSIQKEKAYNTNMDTAIVLINQERDNFNREFKLKKEKELLESQQAYVAKCKKNKELLDEWIERKNRIQKEIKEWEIRFVEETGVNDNSINHLISESKSLSDSFRSYSEQMLILTPIYNKILFDKQQKSLLDHNDKIVHLSQTIAAKKIQKTWRQYQQGKPKKPSSAKKKPGKNKTK